MCDCNEIHVDVLKIHTVCVCVCIRYIYIVIKNKVVLKYVKNYLQGELVVNEVKLGHIF